MVEATCLNFEPIKLHHSLTLSLYISNSNPLFAQINVVFCAIYNNLSQSSLHVSRHGLFISHYWLYFKGNDAKKKLRIIFNKKKFAKWIN